MIILSKISGSPICSRLLALSLRNLSISSKAASNLNCNSEHYETSFNPFIAKPNTSLIRDVGIVGPLWRKKEILELPLTNKVIENPTNLINKVIEEISNGDKTINLPTIDNRTGNDTGKQAKNNMIMVRRRKMRKHKLRKLRKKMKFLWAKVRQRREWRKEKAFTDELVAQVRAAESFSAEQHVAEKIRLATESPMPRTWKGGRLPAFIIKEKLEQEKQKKLARKFKFWEECDKQPDTQKVE